MRVPHSADKSCGIPRRLVSEVDEVPSFLWTKVDVDNARRSTKGISPRPIRFRTIGIHNSKLLLIHVYRKLNLRCDTGCSQIMSTLANAGPANTVARAAITNFFIGRPPSFRSRRER